jgi:hypothetical protein
MQVTRATPSTDSLKSPLEFVSGPGSGIRRLCDFYRVAEFGASGLERLFLGGCHTQQTPPDIVQHSLGFLQQLRRKLPIPPPQFALRHLDKAEGNCKIGIDELTRNTLSDSRCVPLRHLRFILTESREPIGSYWLDAVPIS